MKPNKMIQTKAAIPIRLIPDGWLFLRVMKSALSSSTLAYRWVHNKDVTVAHEKLQAFVREHESKDLRVTLVRPNGKVIYDNMSSDYDHFANHAKREEIAEALKNT